MYFLCFRLFLLSCLRTAQRRVPDTGARQPGASVVYHMLHCISLPIHLMLKYVILILIYLMLIHLYTNTDIMYYTITVSISFAITS